MQDLTVSRTHDAQLWFAKLELGFQAQKEPKCTVTSPQTLWSSAGTKNALA